MSDKDNLRVIICDELGFSRVCTAFLAMTGLQTDSVALPEDMLDRLDRENVSLLVTSYPYGATIIGRATERGIPLIVLYDYFDKEIEILIQRFPRVYFLLKPLDYDKFRDLVHTVLRPETSIA